MKTKRWLISVLILLGFLFTTPTPVQATYPPDPWPNPPFGYLEDIADLVNAAPGSDTGVPTGKQLDEAKDLFTCIVGGANVADCIEQHPLPSGTTSTDTINMLASLYVDIQNSDVWAVVSDVGKWLGSDAPCIIAGLIIPGVGGELCDLVKDIIEAVVDIGPFLVDLAEEAYSALKDVADWAVCQVPGANSLLSVVGMGTDCSKHSKPPLQVITEDFFYGPAGDGRGLSWRECHDTPGCGSGTSQFPYFDPTHFDSNVKQWVNSVYYCMDTGSFAPGGDWTKLSCPNYKDYGWISDSDKQAVA